MMTNFGSTRSSMRRSKSRIKHTCSLEVSDLSPHYMKTTSCSEGKKSHHQASPHSSESSFDSSDQSWSPSSMKSSRTLSRSSSFRSVKILINKSSSKSKNCQQVRVKSTCSSTLKNSKFPQQVELHPGLNESGRISKVKVCSYHHCSLNRRREDDDSLASIKRVFRRRSVLKSQKNIRLESESTNADHFYIEDESTSVSDDVESNYQNVTTPVFRDDEEIDVDFNVTTDEENEKIETELIKNETFVIGTRSLTDDSVEAKCSIEFSSASASNSSTMKLVDNLQDTDDKANQTGNITRDNIGCPEKQENEEKVTNKAEKNAPKHWSNLKRWIILQRFIKELEKLRKFNPRKPRYLELEPDFEAEKVNLKHQIEDERKNAEEWMLDYALQKAISQLALTQKRKVGLLVTAFENVVPHQGSNIQVTFPKLKTRNDQDNLQIADNVCEKNSSRLDKKNADDNWSMLENDDAQKAIVLCHKLDEVTSTSSDEVSIEEKAKQQVKEDGHSKLEREARINVLKASHNDYSLRGTSSTISNLGNDGYGAHESNMNLFECEATESINVSSNANKQKHISMWHMISQHILSDVVSKIGNKLLDETDDEVIDNKPLAEMNKDNSLQNFSEEKDDISHYGRSFSRNDAVNLIREAVSQILTTPTQDDSSDTRSVTSEIVQDEDTNSLCESLRHCDSQETKELAANNTITESTFEPPKSKNWSKLKKLILLKRSIKALERAKKLNPQPPRLTPPTPDQEQDKVDLRNQMTDERKKAEQWMLDNAVQHMVGKLTPARKTRVAMLVEAFEAVVPLPEV